MANPADTSPGTVVIGAALAALMLIVMSLVVGLPEDRPLTTIDVHLVGAKTDYRPKRGIALTTNRSDRHTRCSDVEGRPDEYRRLSTR